MIRRASHFFSKTSRIFRQRFLDGPNSKRKYHPEFTNAEL